jgi:hypothetical protein
MNAQVSGGFGRPPSNSQFQQKKEPVRSSLNSRGMTGQSLNNLPEGDFNIWGPSRNTNRQGVHDLFGAEAGATSTQTKCPKCTETLTLRTKHTHNCNYKQCSFCRSYYPPDLIGFHIDACEMNPQKMNTRPQQNSRGRSQIPASNNQANNRNRSIGPSGNNIVMVETTVLPNGLVIERAFSRNPQGTRNANQRANQDNQGFGAFGSFDNIFGNTFMNNFFSDEATASGAGRRNNGQNTTQVAPVRDARQANRQRQANRMLQPANPLSSIMEFFGITDHPFLAAPSRGRQSGARMMATGPNSGVILISSDPDDEFLQHQSFMRNHQADVANQDFISALLGALMGGALVQRPATRAMDKRELTGLKVTKYVKQPRRKDAEEEQCPICCMEFESGVDVKVLPCKHTFHPGCIDTWLVRNCTCPICKRDVKDLLEGGTGQRPQED